MALYKYMQILFSWLKLWLGIIEHLLRENFRIKWTELFHLYQAEGTVPTLKNPNKSVSRIKGVHGVHFRKNNVNLHVKVRLTASYQLNLLNKEAL